jgi:hypothetical protein
MVTSKHKGITVLLYFCSVKVFTSNRYTKFLSSDLILEGNFVGFLCILWRQCYIMPNQGVWAEQIFNLKGIV